MSMFILVLLAIVKRWSQPRCPSRDEYIKKEEIMPFAPKCMKLEGMLSKTGQTKKKSIMCS
jgi:hypothetical protein